MWIAKNNDLIILAKDTKKELQDALKYMVYTSIEETEEEYELYNGEYLTTEEIAQKQQEQFAKDFFNTSLGWVRRAVHMKDGSVKDFLSDILPLIQPGVPIITYNIDGTQNVGVLVTEEFIGECKQQVLIDFYGAQNDL